MRELGSLVNLQVISITEGKRLGIVADALVDLAAGELVCVTLAGTPELAAVRAEDIEVVGPDALMVSGRDKIVSREDLGDELQRGRSVLANPPAVMTSKGTQLGRLGAVQIDEGSYRVVRFEISGGPLKDVTEGVLTLPVLEGTVHGEDTLIVPHDVVAERLSQAGGLRGSLRSLAQKLRGGYEDISERSEVLLREGGEKIKTGAEHARERADELTKAAREKADRLASEAKEAVAEKREAAAAKPEAAEEGAAEEGPGQAEVEEEVTATEETHLVPGPATPLPEGAAEEDAPVEEEKPVEEDLPIEEEEGEAPSDGETGNSEDE